MRTVDIPNLGLNIWTHKYELPQVNCLHSLTQPEITRQVPFKIMEI